MEKTLKEKESDLRAQTILSAVLVTIFLGYGIFYFLKFKANNGILERKEGFSGVLRAALQNMLKDPLYIFNSEYSAGPDALGLTITLVSLVLMFMFISYTYNKIRLHHNINTLKGSSKWANLRALVRKYAEFENNGKEYKKAYNNAIFSENFQMSLNHKKHFHAMNTLILGATGTGKSRYMLKPNLLQCNCSYVVTDPKGAILNEVGESLRRFGYNVHVFDLVNMGNCDTYNPLKYCTRESDIRKIVQAFMKNVSEGGKSSDPFWDEATSAFLCACIGLMTSCPKGSDIPYGQIPEIIGKKDENGNSIVYAPVFANLCEFTRMAGNKWSAQSGIELMEGVKLGDGKNNTANASELAAIFENLRVWEAKRQGVEVYEMEKPYCLREWENFRLAPEKTSTTILMTTATKLSTFNIQQVRELTSSDTLNLDTFGQSRDVLFVIIPTNDRTYNFLVSFLYTQLFDRIYFNCENNNAGTKNLVLENGELVRHFSKSEVESGVDAVVSAIKNAKAVKSDGGGIRTGEIEKKKKSGFWIFSKTKKVKQKVKFDDGWYDIVASDGSLVTRRPTKELADEYLKNLKSAKLKTASGIASPTHVRFLLDEFANIGEIPEFKEKLATMRAYEISCTVICQSITQLKGMYEKDYEVIDANCPQTVFLGGDENSNNEYVSKKLGNATVRGVNPSSDNKRVNVGTTLDQKPLMSPDELGKMPFEQMIVMVSGEQPIRDYKYDYPNHKNYKFTNDYCCDIGIPDACVFDRGQFSTLKNAPLLIKVESPSAVPTVEDFTTNAFRSIFAATTTEQAIERAKSAATRTSWESSSEAKAF